MPNPLDYLLKRPIAPLKPLSERAYPTPEERESLALAEQEKLHPLKRMAIKALGGLGNFGEGLVTDPTAPREKLDQIGPMGGLGMVVSALPFAPKGIKGMYSRVEKLAETLPSQINPNKLLSILKNRTSGEELNWRKIPEFIKGFGENVPVPKEALVKHLGENPLDVKVVRKGGERPRNIDVINGKSYPEHHEAQYSGYQMPGARNYREDLLTLPERDIRELPKDWPEPFQSKEIYPEDPPGFTPPWELHPPAMENRGFYTGGTREEVVANALRDLRRGGEQQFRSHHWDEPNVLVHVRHNERFLPTAGSTPERAAAIQRGWSGFSPEVKAMAAPEVSKGRMLENVQSDWHQRGAHSGYINPASDPTPNITRQQIDEQAMQARDAVEAKTKEVWAALGEPMDADDESDIMSPENFNYIWNRLDFERDKNPNLVPLQEELRQLKTDWDNALDAANRATGNMVPDAPFKDNWAELALKQQLLDIAHNQPELQWLGIAPSSELRARGEVISPEFQDEQLPRTLEKLLKPFGGGGK